MSAKVGTMIREVLGLRFSRKLIVLFVLVSLSIGILRLDIRSTPITVIFYLMALLASFVLAGMIIYRLVNTKIVEHFLLSIAIGAIPPACGAWLLGSASTRRWVPIGTGMANKSLFAVLAGIAFTLTVALMIEMRFAGSLPPSFEQERRKVFRSFYIGGGLTTGCAIASVCLIGSQTTHSAFQPIPNLVAALFGASIYGTVVIGVLVVILAAVPREDFKALVVREEQQLCADGYPSRCRRAPVQWYLRQALGATLLSITLLLGAVFVWWIAVLALLVSGTWLLYAWVLRGQTPRADENLPLHPVTLVATILAGVSLTFIAHEILPSLEPAYTQTARHLYEIVVFALSVGYVAFAAGHPPEPRSGFLPNLHTVGIWCGIAILAGLGLASAVLAMEHSRGWFLFWITVTVTPFMLAQILLLRSPSVRA
jgi:hypothetical protein